MKILANCLWKLKPALPEETGQNFPYPPLISRLLYNRGITTIEAADLFLSPDKRLNHDPFLFPDMEKAVSRIYKALLAGEKIVVYGDFDADGLTATAVLTTGIARLGGNVTPYIPHRITEGYGLKISALEKHRAEGVSLVISTDCGITAIPEIKRANKIGLDVIVTDHHTPLDELPPAYAIINPKMPCSTYPCKELAGVGVAYKLIQALYRNLGREDEAKDLLDLVAIGTVADIVPILDENRYLVKEGVKLLNAEPRPGLIEMAQLSRLHLGEIEPESISWIMAPRLNAAGRLEHAMAGYKLLTATTISDSQELALWLENKNTERQQLTVRFVEKARAMLDTQFPPALLIFSDAECPQGISGLVAGRLSDEYYRPSIVIKTNADSATGSCRSIPDFNIIQALNHFAHLFSHFGGHAQAAGFTLPIENLDAFVQGISAYAEETLSGMELKPFIDIDIDTDLSLLCPATLRELERLAPFGEANPKPVFLSRGLNITDYRSMGSNNEHLKLRIKHKGRFWDGVAFRQAKELSSFLQSPVDIVYNLELDKWCGTDTLRLKIIDMAPSGTKI
ncbi:single-stranded-DNA-specific exonuclease RecJ [Dehalococcoides mccartyi]|uniref:single-stranded-DNA-specific exonuclease RecJ n=1 Tax=Dehalococcoides mccartyi TaxID=61435 RepID=UPI0006BD4755|nr:single-stranded-DNA-specific exonuclease RecJ [Dehalococcoides mccartyi]BAS31915.1 single-stranded-DNA-specific exonuclease RecJ [Dehalococcoides mccartyi IBARAKI]